MEKEAISEHQAAAGDEARKPCVACGELIPEHAVVCSHCLQPQAQEKSSPMKLAMSWIGYTTAILGLLATLMGGVRWLNDQRKHRAEIKTEMALAQSQTQQAEYDAAVETYQDILKKDPQNRPAADEELNAVMLWVENFSVSGENAAEQAAPKLDQIFSLLDAARVRVHGTQAADVLAHLGWAHFLNSDMKIGQRESVRASEEDLRAALMADPSNVYAHAMLGNWLLQNGGSFPEALGHFATAVGSGKERPMVRTMQLGGLASYENGTGARAEVVKIADEMRRSGEPLDEDQRHRILSFAVDGTITLRGELLESLNAIPPDRVWATYLWLDDHPSDDDMQGLTREFVSANLLEISGKRAEALAKWRLLKQQLKGHPSYSFNGPVDEALRRLSRPDTDQRTAR